MIELIERIGGEQKTVKVREGVALEGFLAPRSEREKGLCPHNLS